MMKIKMIMEKVMNNKIYEFNAIIEAVPDVNGAYVRFPYDIKKNLVKDE